ncbi:hypothetical protein [Bifidobacterium moraviense]|nr:hypothetical protein [Bifidobacterium sp. DSM 109958]
MAMTPVDVQRFGSLSVVAVMPDERDGQQKTDKRSGLPRWRVQALRQPVDGARAQLIYISVPSATPPSFPPMTLIDPVGLVAIDWAMNGSHGLSYMADAVREA